MKPIKQTIYLPVKVEDDLPEIRTNTGMFVMSNIHGWDKLVAHNQMFIPKSGYYLNPKEGYFFTPEQLNEYTANVIKQSLETAAEKGRANGYWYNGEFIHNFPKSAVNKESITNTFEEIFNKLKV